MTAAIRTADSIRERTGATVLLVQQAPLEGRDSAELRPCGSGALSGAAAAILTDSFDRESGIVAVGNVKQKDATPADTRFLSYTTIDLGETDNFGISITTIALCETDKLPAPNRKVTGKHQRKLIQKICAEANGSPELLVAIRDVTGTMDLSREARRKLEQ